LCYLVDTDPNQLMRVIRNLRKELFDEGRVVPFTAIVAKERAEFFRVADWYKDKPEVWRNPNITSGNYCNPLAAALFGRLTKLKAIGICVDKDVVEFLNVETRALLHENLFIADYSQARFRPFIDIRFEKAELTGGVRNNIIREFRQASLRSRKLGRFFIPLLVNWCRSSRLEEKLPDHGISLSKLASTNRLGSIKDGVGIELVYCALLERLAAQDPERSFKGSKRLFGVLKRQKWLRESIRTGTSHFRYAQDCLSEGAKRWFTLKLGESEEQVHGPDLPS